MKNKSEGSMKKFSLFFVAVFSLFAGVLLSACDFKTPKVKFSKEAVAISITDTLNFDDIVSLKDVDKKKVEYKFSSASFFSFEKFSCIFVMKFNIFNSVISSDFLTQADRFRIFFNAYYLFAHI